MTVADSASPFENQGGYVVSPGPGCSPSFRQYVASARAGDVDALFLLESADADAVEVDVLLYKLLNVAADFGHPEAGSFADDLLECSSLRYDDDHFAQGNAHFQLGLAYLVGADGLPVDPDKSRAHLEMSHKCRWPFHVQQGESLLAEARSLLTAAQLMVFDEIYRPG
ncbi:hypothetical protein [Nocardia sp. bgisy134]|uniref:hypothetical protein n=1 Tax=Nocardia sp. bgisy134 TaxID=3413789 RepID=UPI003D734170